MKLVLRMLLIYMAALSMALAQTVDSADGTNGSQGYDEQKARSLESERARLGNQRIQTEAEIRAREEQRQLEEAEQERRLEKAEQERLRTQEEAIRSEEAMLSSESKPSDAGSSTDMSRTLEQLRSLGELRDDGYITEEEFQRIKKKILDSRT